MGAVAAVGPARAGAAAGGGEGNGEASGGGGGGGGSPGGGAYSFAPPGLIPSGRLTVRATQLAFRARQHRKKAVKVIEAAYGEWRYDEDHG